MRQKLIWLLLLALLPFYSGASECDIRKVGELPVPDGYGTAGAYIGVISDAIIVAGGSDFPEGFPWEGGVKKWSDRIYIIKAGQNGYEARLLDEKLPVAAGNGCTAYDGKHIWCFGGTDGKNTVQAVYRISLNGNGVKADSVATLPQGFIPVAAIYSKGEAYVHGTDGSENVLYRYSPSAGSWIRLAGMPGKAISEVATLAAQHNGKEDAIYLIGGRGRENGGYHFCTHVMEYLPARDKWNRKAQIISDGNPAALGAASAIGYGSGHILIFGGDNSKEFLRRASLEQRISVCADVAERQKLQEELTEAFTSHTGFDRNIYAYHPITDTWITMNQYEKGLPVVTSAVKLGDKVVIVSGEERPGQRTPDILEVSINDDVSFGWLNYAVVILYLVIMLGIGFYFSRKEKSTDQFFKGGGKIPWWAAGISIFATALSAITFLSIPAKAYAANWNMFIFNMTIIMTVPVVIGFYLPFFRKLNVASAYQYLEDRFGSAARMLASTFFCVFMFARVAIVLFLPSLALNAVTGLNIYLCIVMMGVVTIIYCTMGGIEAVVWGDVIQGIILLGGALLSLIWIISGVDGGLGTVMQVAIEEEKFQILDFTFDLSQPVFWVAIVGGFANQLLTYTSDQSVIQRYITVKDTAGTKKSLWLNGILSIPVAIIFFGIGTALFVFFKSHPEMLNVGMSNTDSIFPHYIMYQLPKGIAGLLIAAIFAAAMSTLSSNINSASTVMTEDFYARYRKGADEGHKMRFAKTSGVVVGGLGVIMAVAMATFDIASLWDQFNFFLGLLTSGVGGLFTMGIFSKRIGLRAAITGFVGSILVLLAANSYTNISTTLYGFIGLVSCCLIGWLSSFVFGYRK